MHIIKPTIRMNIKGYKKRSSDTEISKDNDSPFAGKKQLNKKFILIYTSQFNAEIIQKIGRAHV